MTKADREKWDARYQKRLGRLTPASVLSRYCRLAPAGRALDIACGNGRNSLYLAEQGFAVDAVDISSVATMQLAARRSDINVICADLDLWDIPPQCYSLIVNIRFLDRRLFPQIREGLLSGGVLIFESFMGEEHPHYCLKPNELLRAFRELRVVYYEEKATPPSEKFDQVASLVAVKN